MAIIVALQLILYFGTCLMEGIGETNEIHGSKRLLLNDPDAINNRLNNLERSLQQQQAAMLQQQATILQQQATIQQLKQNIPQGEYSAKVSKIFI